ncbi:hypothetical protein DQM68_06260 [Leptospira mayottensis]|uniref:Uncharacterized protein n=1 Tax=Leptospira mayottensis TaxID=1137606 RepID=A0ABN5NS20_9LEPT|nr:hypothetical protein DQM68_06260 [Leptospira mayottensis]AXR64166.1 hypothetical protein DQM28_07970 [Leptospira mayottensis]AXR67877.1 hypothetical protein DPV73_07475 [Leptospira mayottensis]AZQ03220.1 hypothetical protein LEP1GSC190_15430 [Leptospira mayottensis 200901116]TGN06607.1 hypothetical protein EHR03_10005 [Leptospira mayottensis]
MLAFPRTIYFTEIYRVNIVCVVVFSKNFTIPRWFCLKASSLKKSRKIPKGEDSKKSPCRF